MGLAGAFAFSRFYHQVYQVLTIAAPSVNCELSFSLHCFQCLCFLDLLQSTQYSIDTAYRICCFHIFLIHPFSYHALNQFVFFTVQVTLGAILFRAHVITRFLSTISSIVKQRHTGVFFSPSVCITPNNHFTVCL